MELLHDLGIEPPVILVNIIGFLVLLALLRKFFFGPVGEFLSARRQEVVEQLEDAEQSQQQAAEELATIRSRREEMMAEAAEEAREARNQAERQAEQTVNEARQQALDRERRAADNIAQQTAQALAEVRNQVSGLSVEFAERVLRDSLDEQQQGELLAAALRDVEKLARRENE